MEVRGRLTERGRKVRATEGNRKRTNKKIIISKTGITEKETAKEIRVSDGNADMMVDQQRRKKS